MKRFTAMLQKEDNMYVARCLEVGTTSQGNTQKQALKNLKDATELYIGEFPMKSLHEITLATFKISIKMKD